MAITKQIVHLRVYKSSGFGNQISKGEDGKIQNENYPVKVIHNTVEWANYLKYIGIHGFVKVEVEKVMQPIKDGYEEVKEFDAIKKEVENALNPKAKTELTPEQKRIAELEAKLEALISSGKKESKTDSDDELSKARKNKKLT